MGSRVAWDMHVSRLQRILHREESSLEPTLHVPGVLSNTCQSVRFTNWKRGVAAVYGSSQGAPERRDVSMSLTELL
jgi:hypothetical protein